MQYVGTSWDKAMVKVNQPQELSELALCVGLWKLTSNLYFLLKGSYSLAVDVMA